MRLVIGIVIGVLGVLGYQEWQKRRAPPPHVFDEVAMDVEAPQRFSAPASASEFRCDGRQHCRQMKSCEEAEFFLQNCPGVKMDGDGDGLPCEDICRH